MQEIGEHETTIIEKRIIVLRQDEVAMSVSVGFCM